MNRTSGKLCLIVCALKPLHLRATNASNREDDYNCNIRVNLQINSYINITLRWLVEGRLYSTITDPHNESYFAELKLQSYWLLNGVHEHKVARPITYIYTWIDEIHNRLRANGTSADRSKWNYKYPTSSGQDLCLTDLAHQLRLDAVSSQFIMKRSKKSVHLKLDVIAVESCVILEGDNQPRTEYSNVTRSNLLRMGVEIWLDPITLLQRVYTTNLPAQCFSWVVYREMLLLRVRFLWMYPTSLIALFSSMFSFLR